jgi:hypothetical protein
LFGYRFVADWHACLATDLLPTGMLASYRFASNWHACWLPIRCQLACLFGYRFAADWHACSATDSLPIGMLVCYQSLKAIKMAAPVPTKMLACTHYYSTKRLAKH